MLIIILTKPSDIQRDEVTSLPDPPWVFEHDFNVCNTQLMKQFEKKVEKIFLLNRYIMKGRGFIQKLSFHKK